MSKGSGGSGTGGRGGGDSAKWASASRGELGGIAKSYAQKYSTSKLRTLQAHYEQGLSQATNSQQAKEFQNRLAVVSAAIDIREFGGK